MKESIDNVYKLVDALKVCKEEITDVVQTSVDLYRKEKDSDEFTPADTLVTLAFKSGSNDEETKLTFITEQDKETGMMHTYVLSENEKLGVFRFDDEEKDFDEKGKFSPDTKDFITTFITQGLAHKKLDLLFAPFLATGEGNDYASVISNVSSLLKMFGLNINVVEGSSVNSVSVYNIHPYDIISHFTSTLSIFSPYTRIMSTGNLISLIRATLYGLFDSGKLKGQ